MKPEFETAYNKAVDSFESAELLFSHQRFTAMINRCYYALYYIVSTMVDERKNQHVKTHSGLIKIFSEEFIKNKKLPDSLLLILITAFEKRQFADYDFESCFSEEEAMELLLKTKYFLDIIKSFLESL